MKAAIFNPYWDSLGGGERYCVGVIKALEKQGYSVHVEWNDNDLPKKLESRFGIKLARTKIVSTISRGDGYDVCFWVSDGSVPTLKSRNNILHFQMPFTNVGGRSLINKMKLFRIRHVVCNSMFTKNVIDREFGINSKVLYPPVSVSLFKSKKKENQIVYIGRFSKLAQRKRQDLLIEVFKKFYEKNKSWKMVIAGGAEIGNDFVDSLRDLSKGYPIQILESPKFAEVKDIVGKSKLFWSAAGYGVDEVKKPTEVEHFGITLVEAMAAKTVPVVVDRGGFREIINNEDIGILWKKKSELLSLSEELARDSKRLRIMGQAASVRSLEFSEDKFEVKFADFLK